MTMRKQFRKWALLFWQRQKVNQVTLTLTQSIESWMFDLLILCFMILVNSCLVRRPLWVLWDLVQTMMMPWFATLL